MKVYQVSKLCWTRVVMTVIFTEMETNFISPRSDRDVWGFIIFDQYGTIINFSIPTIVYKSMPMVAFAWLPLYNVVQFIFFCLCFFEFWHGLYPGLSCHLFSFSISSLLLTFNSYYISCRIFPVIDSASMIEWLFLWKSNWWSIKG